MTYDDIFAQLTSHAPCESVRLKMVGAVEPALVTIGELRQALSAHRIEPGEIEALLLS